MTDYVVKCTDVSWQRHSVSIYIGNYRTKLQRLNGEWDPLGMVGERVRPEDLSDAEDYARETYGDGRRPGSPGIWTWDDAEYDRLTIWRPPYTVDIKRASILVTSDVDASTSNYYNFKLLNSADDTLMTYLYTSSTSLSGESPNEMTVISTANTVLLTQAVILQIEDELAIAPITGLTIVIDYEPSA